MPIWLTWDNEEQRSLTRRRRRDETLTTVIQKVQTFATDFSLQRFFKQKVQLLFLRPIWTRDDPTNTVVSATQLASVQPARTPFESSRFSRPLKSVAIFTIDIPDPDFNC